MRRLVVLAAGVFAAFVTTNAYAVDVKANANNATFRNNDGTWVIFRRCRGPHALGDRNITVGPGYIASGWDNRGRALFADSGNPADMLTNSGATGLGLFGFHEARTASPFSTIPGVEPWIGDFNHSWSVDGRTCAHDSFRHYPNNRVQPGGFTPGRKWGVTRWRESHVPRVVNNVGYYGIYVYLGDPAADLLRIQYFYEIRRSQIKSTITVTNLCASGCPASLDDVPGLDYAYIKEPKFIAGVNPRSPDAIGYRRMVVILNDGEVKCPYVGEDPTSGTGQCGEARRNRVRFDFGFGTSCSATKPCLNIVARAIESRVCSMCPPPILDDGLAPETADSSAPDTEFDPTGDTASSDSADYEPTAAELDASYDPAYDASVDTSQDGNTYMSGMPSRTYLWERASLGYEPWGLDRWAIMNVLLGRERAGSADSVAGTGSQPSHCGGTSPTNPAASDHQNVRRWELGGYAKTSQGSYTRAVAGFHSWEGGSGPYDCEPLYYLFPEDAGERSINPSEEYSVYTSYSINAGYSNS